MKPRVLILSATGTNRDHDACTAFELAGGQPEITPLNLLRMNQKHFSDYQILVLPGGFSYADALGAGKLLALDLHAYFTEEVKEMIDQGKPVIGICNGFQALVKSGILPALQSCDQTPQATLTFNEKGHFECRWVTLQPKSQKCLWTRNLRTVIHCPVAHGEGRFFTGSEHMLVELSKADQIALTYAYEDGRPASGAYPLNPNGSELDIAGVCNPQGNVLGLMPHPENHIFPYQHPRWKRNEQFSSGLPLFQNGVDYCRKS
jgi:phosphoribosylformylglycinamidine synthase subunit PurQ / glutaminase